MRKAFFLLVILFALHSGSYGQYYPHVPKFFVHGSVSGGEISQDFKSIPMSSGYESPLNTTNSNLRFTDGQYKSMNVECGYYIGHKREFGFGIGLNYTAQLGTMKADSFHVEYQSVDYKRNAFRQVISSGASLEESVRGNSVNLPIFICYRKKLFEDFYFTSNLGVLLNLNMSYKATAKETSFNYEAIYKFVTSGGFIMTEYDNNPVANSGDWFITQQQYLQDKPGGDVSTYFANMKTNGYTVALDAPIRNKTNNVVYKPSSVGYFMNADICYKINDRFYGKGGIYFSYQTFKNTVNDTKLIIPPNGFYNSIMNYATDITTLTYGLTFGMGMYFMYQ